MKINYVQIFFHFLHLKIQQAVDLASISFQANKSSACWQDLIRKLIKNMINKNELHMSEKHQIPTLLINNKH